MSVLKFEDANVLEAVKRLTAIRYFGEGHKAMAHIAEVLNELSPTIAAMAFYEGQTNQRITLDSGKIVGGMQCWWGSEEVIIKKIAGRPCVTAEGY